MRQLLLKAVQASVFLFVLFGNIYFDWQLTGQLAGLSALLAAIFSTAAIIAVGDIIAWAGGFARRLKRARRGQLRPERYRQGRVSITGSPSKPERAVT